jgi:hypothetical protein
MLWGEGCRGSPPGFLWRWRRGEASAGSRGPADGARGLGSFYGVRVGWLGFARFAQSRHTLRRRPIRPPPAYIF